MSTHKKKKSNLKYLIALYIVYFIIFFTASALLDYYAYLTLDAKVLLTISIVCAALATLLHHRYRIKTKADELAKEIEEIL